MSIKGARGRTGAGAMAERDPAVARKSPSRGGDGDDARESATVIVPEDLAALVEYPVRVHEQLTKISRPGAARPGPAPSPPTPSR